MAGRLVRLEVELARHRRAEEEARQSGERFRLLIEHAREYVFRYACQSQQIEYISPGIVDLCGYSAAEVCDNPHLILDIVHPDDRLLLQHYIEAGDFSKMLTLRCLHRDRSVVWVEQRSLPSYRSSWRTGCPRRHHSRCVRLSSPGPRTARCRNGRARAHVDGTASHWLDYAGVP